MYLYRDIVITNVLYVYNGLIKVTRTPPRAELQLAAAGGLGPALRRQARFG